MLFNALAASSILVATVYATTQPYKLAEARMSLNQVFGLVGRQNNGYSPTQHLCGSGDTCAEACGPTTVQCASDDGDLHCYDPTIGQLCCPDGTGNACDTGYFCTKDTSGNTWCCPNGLDLASCAAAYSLSGALFSESATATSSLAPSTSPLVSNTTTAVSTTTIRPSSGGSSAAAPTNGTITSSTPVFTGGANEHRIQSGLQALALAAGALLVL